MIGLRYSVANCGTYTVIIGKIYIYIDIHTQTDRHNTAGAFTTIKALPNTAWCQHDANRCQRIST